MINIVELCYLLMLDLNPHCCYHRHHHYYCSLLITRILSPFLRMMGLDHGLSVIVFRGNFACVCTPFRTNHTQRNNGGKNGTVCAAMCGKWQHTTKTQ